MAEPVARATMLIRRPRAEVFDAFVQPPLITKFWLKSTTGPLSAGGQVVKTLLETGRSANLVADRAELIHRARVEAR